ncbi:Clavaminate synthase-like protein [Fomitiporia mediterranea MF3/22]|uniref:Clavaminate synthase-like protein n=1 Tax=Fomitiporia mediterranea (strain MF3/22) TaxID=694068 RepID=UPI0004407E59|nr:Clavaminate synthase-like protein [Fomitiporia mediterranea MF3/22]EJD07621.1 Clavaminate synthase-like protein [Fomitiporia mediterranea MF3/22]
MPEIALPPFPQDVTAHALLVIDYELSATELGFWYLKNHGANPEADGMFEMRAATMKPSMEEKLAARKNATDEHGNLDTVEFINISKDDGLAYPKPVHRTYPSTTLRVRKSLEINNTVLSIFEKKLGLPPGVLLNLHALSDPSGSEARCIKNSPKYVDGGAETNKNAKSDNVTFGAHKDFGSLSISHNRLEGLQVPPLGSLDWQYVRIILDYAICNVGDTLTLPFGGILRSNLHRVAAHTRWSVVFFTRPGNEVHLHPLTNKSNAIKATVSRMFPEERAKYEPDATAIEWFARRIRNQRIKNRTGPETWRASRGMEHKPEII